VLPPPGQVGADGPLLKILQRNQSPQLEWSSSLQF
jgi:hypothetical protein